MLRVKARQVDTFSVRRVDEFEQRTVQRLREFFPSFSALEDVEALSVVRQGIHRAEKYGFTTERDVAKYIGLMVIWGVDFDEIAPDSWLVSILSNRFVEPSERLALLYEHALREEGT